jgi:hypothetical protein
MVLELEAFFLCVYMIIGFVVIGNPRDENFRMLDEPTLVYLMCVLLWPVQFFDND